MSKVSSYFKQEKRGVAREKNVFPAAPAPAAPDSRPVEDYTGLEPGGYRLASRLPCQVPNALRTLALRAAAQHHHVLLHSWVHLRHCLLLFAFLPTEGISSEEKVLRQFDLAS